MPSERVSDLMKRAAKDPTFENMGPEDVAKCVMFWMHYWATRWPDVSMPAVMNRVRKAFLDAAEEGA